MKRIVIVGAGALGSHVALLLRNAASIVVVDFDSVEAKNLPSQLHWRSGVGRKKVNSLAGFLKTNFGTVIEPWDIKLTADNAAKTIGLTAPALIVDAVDNAAGRQACEAASDKTGIPCLHGGLAAAGAYGMVRWGKDFIIDDAPPGVPTCEDGGHLPFVVGVAARMAMAAQTFLTTGEQHGYAVAPDSVTRL